MKQPQSNAQAAKARAVAAFNSAAAKAQSPVLDQNQVSPEEVGAIKAATAGQNDTGIEEEVIEDTLQASETTEETTVDTALSPEETPAEPTEEAPKDPALSRQFAQLARQERALRQKAAQQEASFKAREDALNKRMSELESKDKEYQTGYIQKDRLKQNALSVLAEAGISYDDITQQALNAHPTDPRVEATISRLEAKIMELEKANETSQTRQTEAQKQQYEAAVKQIELEAKSLISKDPAFETVKATNSIKDVVELITQTYEQDGILLSVEEAAQQVEDYLIEEAMKLTKIDKIKKRLQPATSTTPPEVKAAAKTLADHARAKNGQTQPMKTLTNAAGTSRQLSGKERAILAFKGELK